MKLKLFAVSLLLTLAVQLTPLYLHRPGTSSNPQLHHLGDGVFYTSQLAPEGVARLRRDGVSTVVDIRPDGETSDQPPSTEIARAAAASGLDFHYIPVPHEGIPEQAVAQLGQLLAQADARPVLYCRTGRRAVRTYALAEASLADGPDAVAIFDTVRRTGFSVDDLKDDINRRIANRNHLQPARNDAN